MSNNFLPVGPWPTYVALFFCMACALLMMFMFHFHTESFGHASMLEKTERIEIRLHNLEAEMNEIEMFIVREHSQDQ